MKDPRPRFSQPVDPPPEGTPWTVLRLLRWSTQYLEAMGIPGVRTDVEHLLAHSLDMGRLDLYLHFERPLTSEELDGFRPLLRERARRKPLQYILGQASFRELELAVDERVLIPRPETEELVEAVLSRVREWGRENLVAVDVGTGSGAIALSLALEGPFGQVWATDQSSDALDVARINARTHELEQRIRFVEGDLFEALPPDLRVDVVVSNPPYVAEAEMDELEPEVRMHEPRSALVAADEGRSTLRRLVAESPGVLVSGGLLALEVGAGQAPDVAGWIEGAAQWGRPVVLRDMGRKERIVLAVRRGDGAGSSRVDI